MEADLLVDEKRKYIYVVKNIKLVKIIPEYLKVARRRLAIWVQQRACDSGAMSHKRNWFSHLKELLLKHTCKTLSRQEYFRRRGVKAGHFKNNRFFLRQDLTPLTLIFSLGNKAASQLFFTEIIGSRFQ